MAARVARPAGPQTLARLWIVLVWGTGWLAIKLALGGFAPLFLAGSSSSWASRSAGRSPSAAPGSWPASAWSTDRPGWRG